MFVQNQRFVGAGLLAVLVIAMSAHFETSDALPTLSGTFACAKDYMVNLVRDKIISKSALVAEYKASMRVVEAKFDEAERSGLLDGKDDKEIENYYLKLTVDEMQALKKRIEKSHLTAQSLDLSDDQKHCLVQGKTDDDEYDPDAEVEGWTPEQAASEQNDEEIEAALMTELEELERQAKHEDEMGWSMAPEVKEKLKVQTRNVLVDLMQNEARQIAFAVLQAYMTGGTSIATVVLPLLGGLKFKLAEFLINAITEIFSSVMGRQIVVTPSSVVVAPQAEAATTLAPVAADAVAVAA